MKHFFTICLCFLFVILIAKSEEPKLMWHTSDKVLSDILYSGKSFTGDTLVIVEQHYIKLINSSSFEIMSSIPIMSFNYSSADPSKTFTQLTLNNIYHINLPYIIVGNYLLNISDNSIYDYVQGKLIDFKMNNDGKSAYFVTSSKNSSNQEESKLYVLDFDSKSTNGIFSISHLNKSIENIQKFSADEYIFIFDGKIHSYTDGKFKLLTINGLEGVMIDNLKSHKYRDIIYFYSNNDTAKLLKLDLNNLKIENIPSFDSFFSDKENYYLVSTFIDDLNPNSISFNYVIKDDKFNINSINYQQSMIISLENEEINNINLLDINPNYYQYPKKYSV